MAMLAVVMVFSGEYDLRNLRELRRDLAPLQREPDIVLDFTEVTFLDAASLKEFLALHEARNACGFPRETMIVKPGSPIERVLYSLRLDKLFTIVRRDNESCTDSAVVQYAFALEIVEPDTDTRLERYAKAERRRFPRNWSELRVLCDAKITAVRR
jgi:anti-anti-sigma regulatory factor